MARVRSWRELWMASGLGILGCTCLLGFFRWQEASELRRLEPDAAARFSAVMSREGKSFVFNTAGKSRIVCTTDRCSYPDSQLDEGVARRFVMSGGWLLGVERDGRFIDVRSTTLARKQQSLRFISGMGALSLPCFWLAYLMRNSPSPKMPSWARPKGSRS